MQATAMFGIEDVILSCFGFVNRLTNKFCSLLAFFFDVITNIVSRLRYNGKRKN